MSNIIMNNYRQKRLKVCCTYRVTVAKLSNMSSPWCYLLWKKKWLKLVKCNVPNECYDFTYFFFHWLIYRFWSHLSYLVPMNTPELTETGGIDISKKNWGKSCWLRMINTSTSPIRQMYKFNLSNVSNCKQVINAAH